MKELERSRFKPQGPRPKPYHSTWTQAGRQEKTQAARKDPSRKTSQGTSFKTRPKYDKMDYTMAKYGPSSTLNETDSPVYGENVDYAIKIVEHFLNFIPGMFYFPILLSDT